jgi:hypothetical protein
VLGVGDDQGIRVANGFVERVRLRGNHTYLFAVNAVDGHVEVIQIQKHDLSIGGHFGHESV